MCGIFGYSFQADKETENLFFESMIHRGPDDQTSSAFSNWTLGHLRLSIIDTNNRANQPMESNGNSIIFNGEIYNFTELKNEYINDIELKTTSDTEVLLELLNKYGLEILNKLNGMFAFAYFNQKTGSVTLCRDRFGVKPLHYMKHQGNFFFSSEIKPLIKIKSEVSFNEKIIEKFFKETASDFDGRTFINEINQVEAGCFIEVNQNGEIINKNKWYKENDFLFDKKIFNNYSKTIDFYEDLLVDSIKLRHRSDVPVCITLSGGLDSSTLYVLAKEKLNSKIQPFTLSHPGANTDELQKAKLLADTYNDEILVVVNKQSEGVENIIESLNYLEFPIWTATAPAFLDTYRSIKENGFKVVIEGHGSDEQLGGYPHHIDSAWKELFLKFQFKSAYKTYKVFQETKNPKLNQTGNFSKQPSKIVFHMIKDLILTLLRQIKNPGSQNISLQNTLDKDFNHKILPMVLRTFDRMSMSQSIESRCPFMDYRLVEFTRAMPTKFKVNEIGSKAPLREILKKYNKDFIYKDKLKMGWSSDLNKLFSDATIREFFKTHVENFNDPKFNHLKEEALSKFDKEKIDWQDVSVIWKIASIDIISNTYGIYK